MVKKSQPGQSGLNIFNFHNGIGFSNKHIDTFSPMYNNQTTTDIPIKLWKNQQHSYRKSTIFLHFHEKQKRYILTDFLQETIISKVKKNKISLAQNSSDKFRLCSIQVSLVELRITEE